MATNPQFFNSDLKDKTISRNTVAAAINQYISAYLDGTMTDAKTPVTNGGTGFCWSGEDTTIRWGGTTYDLITKNVNQIISEFMVNSKDKTIKAEEFCDLVTKCLWYACRVAWQRYWYYPDVGWKNWHNYTPDIVSSDYYRGLSSEPYVSTHDEYKEIVSGYRPAGMYADNIIKAEDIDDFMTSLVEYNERMEAYYDANGAQPVNTCYSSCHNECHGSSRGRR